ncbi:ribonuclease III [Youxingia wuxianensis]|uniref:Ribonuclease 3 n=1 Tax=Youxingia wuxianensis TaxID=2763678 RepID=A0A926EQ90_9FIRM|nr:ribonuclease III [Youxingia wuxianensis]MBC8584379.1 ribonuclease III [Youxingia wuxianensis]
MSNSVSFEELEKTIGYTFKNKKYLDIALTHSSYANEVKKNLSSNERQEFLGDAVLSIIVSEYLFNTFHLAEGELTKLRAAMVCEKSLWEFAQEIHLGDYLKLGKGEEMMGGRTRASILADAFEALIAAIFLDGGMDEARKFVLGFIIDVIENKNKFAFNDYKTMLQEIIQKNPEERLTYVLVEESGPDHNKRFVVEVHLNSNVIGRGKGQSKKSAEQMAAKEALKLMGQ